MELHGRRMGRAAPASPSLQLEILVRCREQVAGDQAQAGLGHAWAIAVENSDLVDGREHGALVHQLLDAVQGRLAALAVALYGLLLDEALDVGIGPVRVDAAGRHPRLQPSRRVAVRAVGEIHERAWLLL